ncbi:cysteine--1-D-myo-inosityl 2-amino-2-deoxy-alpha-D-glucopyranoside ligase [Acaricomes phytoseiuli]|uniref:cysteine--1-D-myo-inosityl 2-amino-2-deoxy-alpha-D-glucopyranoside ligase n=1 Tax=Acaricomes phytoseiuli TaxID=291968 RepID=UPI000368B991|nr:cysteine--1-D-myo-inosityl 2-amino-2-deoxy-alpha-D-glucopyranoside ligase [Acaricomes phytoseiuli]MCW1248754.1 cysteine--1-D-myo-inosityl 2-amino-2-deoxy-alpha-D-glucopyranoside ligase [Acaricomes phytoseiuli]
MKSWVSRPQPELPGTLTELSVYDSVAQERQPLLPESREASLYVCGITPYDATHLGHAATYVAFDLLGRAWRDAGVCVQYVQNVTDVDDPLLERAERDGTDWRVLAQEQTQLFREDMAALSVTPPQHYIGAVESIDRVASAVAKLLAEGTAYKVQDAETGATDIYFDVRAAGADTQAHPEQPGAWSLGSVSGLDEAQMLPLFAERGGDPERAGKRHSLDPLLWRGARPGEPSWPGGALGEGRPGWHIECTVIARQFLAAPLTVQGGGADLIFPHHEMGAGHAWALDHTPLARHYLHSGMVGLDGEKMSKSRGNLVLVSALREQGADPAAIRLAILSQHYRSDWSWHDRLLAEAQLRLERWREALDRAPEGSAKPLLAAVRQALGADLDAPAALEAVDRWAAEAHDHPARPGNPDGELVRDTVDALLGVRL